MKYLLLALIMGIFVTPMAMASGGHDEPVVEEQPVDTHDDDENTHEGDEPEVELDENGNPMHGETGHDHEVHHGQLD